MGLLTRGSNNNYIFSLRFTTCKVLKLYYTLLFIFLQLLRMISYDTWMEHCNFLKLKSENELNSSQKLRESMYVPRERARMDLQGQNDATNFSLRKRIYEIQRIKNELDWQRLNVRM